MPQVIWCKCLLNSTLGVVSIGMWILCPRAKLSEKNKSEDKKLKNLC